MLSAPATVSFTIIPIYLELCGETNLIETHEAPFYDVFDFVLHFAVLAATDTKDTYDNPEAVVDTERNQCQEHPETVVESDQQQNGGDKVAAAQGVEGVQLPFYLAGK